MTMNGFKVTYTECGDNYFEGGNGTAYTKKTQVFITWEDAQKFYFNKRKEVKKEMGWCEWWMKKYYKEQNNEFWNIVDCEVKYELKEA